MKNITVVGAKYIEGYKVSVFFSDNTSKDIDFGAFLMAHPHEQWNKYKNLTNFKKFKIEQGNIVWGRNWDIIFPVQNLYIGDLTAPCC
jgi:hypothetical protein